MKNRVCNYVRIYILLAWILKKLRIVVWSMYSYRLNILFQNSSSILKWSQVAVKELMIKHICGKTASNMMDYWGLEIDSLMNLWCKKEQPYIFTHWNWSFKPKLQILLTKSSAHIPWILREKRKATNTSSQGPQLNKPHAAFSWGENSWASGSTMAFLSSAKNVLEIWLLAPKYLAACAKLLTLQYSKTYLN